MAENSDTAFVNLKRKIIAVDKLKKHITKTDAKIAELTKQVGEKDSLIEENGIEIAKLKAELLESLVTAGDGNVSSGEVEDLKRNVDEKQKLLDSKSHQVFSLQSESNAKSKKIECLESDLKKLKSRLAAIEKDLKSKNENIIQRELESQGLKQQVEDLQREKKSLETSMKSGQHLDDFKRSYEESKWKNLAEISKLKQENSFLEKQVKELAETNESVNKTNAELQRQIDGQHKQSKLNDSLEKSLEKKDKNILALEKKLAQALQDNEKLKARLKNKHIDIPVAKPLTQLFDTSRTSEDEKMEDEDESDCEVIEEAEEKPFMRFLSFSFSNPGSRFQIVRPKPPTKKKFHFLFTKKATTIDTIPNVLNIAPRISDHFTKLSQPLKRVSGKRKHKNESSTSEDVKRLRSDPYNSSLLFNETLPSSLSLTDSVLASPPIKQSTKKRRKQSSSSDQDSPAGPITKTKKQSLSESFHPSHNSTAIQEPGDNFTEPNPVRSRKAHPKQSIQAALSSVPKFEPKKKKEEKLPRFPGLPPQLLSPIKSPKVSATKTPPTKPKVSQTRVAKALTAAPSSESSPTPSASPAASTASARERIKAASLAPVTVEAPVKSVGGKLNPTQLEAARRRAVPTSATTMAPSVDGFRQSSKKAAVSEHKLKTEVKKAGKVAEELLYCPSRKRTNPSRITNSVDNKTEPSVVKTEAPDASASVKSEKIKSKEEDTEDESDVKLKIASVEDDNLKSSQVETKEALMTESVKETLDGDLTVSDSDDDEDVDEKPAPTKTSRPNDEFFESDDEPDQKGRFSKLKSERHEDELSLSVRAPPEFKPLVGDVKTPDLQRAPDKPKVFDTLLEEAVHGFKVRIEKQYMDLQTERQKLSRERSEMLYDATVDCLRKHFRNLMGCQNEASFDKLVSSVASANNPQNEAMICDLVYEYLKSEHKDTPLLSEADSEQPPITRKQQRLFALLTALSKLERYSGIMERMIALLWHNLFGRDRMYNLKLNAVQNTGRMFILCARFCDNIEIVKNFIYDLFYFKSPRNHILIGIVIALWPQVFPSQGEPLSQTPMMETIVWCVFNTGPEVYSPEMMVNETKEIMEKDYNYRPSSHKAEELVIRFLKLAEENVGDGELMGEITRSLLLLGRSRDYRWVQNNIFSRLMKLLGDIWAQSQGQGSFLAWVITTLGLLSRVYPAEGREQLRGIYQPVEQLLTNGGLDPDTEDACVMALFHLGYHMQTQVAQFLKKWRPTHPLRERTRRVIEDFLGTRAKKYAEITLKVVRTERNRARKRKGLK